MATNLNISTNTTEVSSRDNSITITDNNTGNIVNISQQDTSLEIMLSENFWNQVIAETVLYFECDSMLCPNSEYKVEDFEHFDYIGGYWGNILGTLDSKYERVINRTL